MCVCETEREKRREGKRRKKEMERVHCLFLPLYRGNLSNITCCNGNWTWIMSHIRTCDIKYHLKCWRIFSLNTTKNCTTALNYSKLCFNLVLAHTYVHRHETYMNTYPSLGVCRFFFLWSVGSSLCPYSDHILHEYLCYL